MNPVHSRDYESQASEHLLENSVGSVHEGHFVKSYDDKVDEEERAVRNSRLSYASSFSALHPANSAYLTTFLLINTMIGSGILNQPFVFMESGLLGGLLGYILAATATWTALLCMTETGLAYNILEYSSLAHRAFDKTGEKLVDLSIIILTFGAQLGYILVVGSTLSSLLDSWGCGFIMCNDIFTTLISVGAFMLPVCLFRHFGHLAWISLFSVAAILAVLILVVIGGPMKHNIEHYSSHYTLFDITGTLRSTGSIVFSLACASANFQAFISTEKKSQTLPAWSWVTGTAIGVGSLMCVIMGTVGYMSFSDQTQGMILDNFPQHGYDFFKIMVVTHLILYIPVNFVIMRYSLVKICTGMRSELLPATTHAILTTFLLAFTAAMVIVLMTLGLSSGTAFSLILNITGGIGGE